MVSPAPEIFVEPRCPDEDEFLVLACDGIWDVMTNEDVCKFIHYQLTLTDDLTKVAASVVDHCLFKVIIIINVAIKGALSNFSFDLLHFVLFTGKSR